MTTTQPPAAKRRLLPILVSVLLVGLVGAAAAALLLLPNPGGPLEVEYEPLGEGTTSAPQRLGALTSAAIEFTLPAGKTATIVGITGHAGPGLAMRAVYVDDEPRDGTVWAGAVEWPQMVRPSIGGPFPPGAFVAHGGKEPAGVIYLVARTTATGVHRFTGADIDYRVGAREFRRHVELGFGVCVVAASVRNPGPELCRPRGS